MSWFLKKAYALRKFIIQGDWSRAWYYLPSQYATLECLYSISTPFRFQLFVNVQTGNQHMVLYVLGTSHPCGRRGLISWFLGCAYLLTSSFHHQGALYHSIFVFGSICPPFKYIKLRRGGKRQEENNRRERKEL